MKGCCRTRLTAINRRHSPWVAGTVQTVIAVLLVVPFAILGKDPVLTLFSWFSGVAVLGIMLLYFLTSVSVIVYFRRSGADTRLWNTLIAPVLGARRHRGCHLAHHRQLHDAHRRRPDHGPMAPAHRSGGADPRRRRRPADAAQGRDQRLNTAILTDTAGARAPAVSGLCRTRESSVTERHG